MMQYCYLRRSKWQSLEPPPGFARYKGGWYVKPIDKDQKAFKKAKSKREMHNFGIFSDNKSGGGDSL